METEHPFDARLREAAKSGERLPSLGDLMAETVARTGSDHVVVNAVVSDGNEPASILSEVAGDSCMWSERVDDVAILQFEHRSRPFVVSLWPTPSDGVWLVVSTVRFTSKEWRKVERWLQRAAPQLTPVYLPHDGLASLCERLSRFGDVRVSKITGTLPGGTSDQRGYRDDPYLHRPSYSEALSEFEPGGSAKTMQVTVGDELALHIRRRAGLTYKGGDPHLFANAALKQLAGLSADAVHVFRDRERKVRAPMPKPVAIDVPDGQFAKPDHLHSFVARLDRISDVGVAVLHGNPYLHVIITDYRDGSNFDLFITDDHQIRLYPGFRTSVGSLTRFADSLSEILPAMDVHEAGPKQGLTREDFLVGA